MSLAHRASTIYQPGEARKQARDLESCDTLIRSLPPASSETVRKVHGELCTEIGKPCSATDLSRALHNLRHSIDADLRLHGAGDSRSRNKFQARNQSRGKTNSYSSYGISTAVTPPPPPPSPMRSNALSARGATRATSGQRRTFPPFNIPSASERRTQERTSQRRS